MQPQAWKAIKYTIAAAPLCLKYSTGWGWKPTRAGACQPWTQTPATVQVNGLGLESNSIGRETAIAQHPSEAGGLETKPPRRKQTSDDGCD